MLNSYILVPEIPVPSILYIWSGPANSKSNSYGAVTAYETSTKWTCYGLIQTGKNLMLWSKLFPEKSHICRFVLAQRGNRRSMTFDVLKDPLAKIRKIHQQGLKNRD